uniref:Thymidine phosphorylase-like n=1 Tax=Hirondellea gigas TaxID=1518452 RepID=A0A6A7FTU1_9CRUS
MKTPSEAEGLARSLVETMGAMGVTTTALITAMDHPIGRTIGNALEVRESLDCLMGGGPPDLQELVVALGGELLTSANLCVSVEEGRDKILATLKDGTALAAFKNMIVSQGVDEQTARRLCTEKSSSDCLPKAKHTTPVCAKTSGTITEENALALAEVSAALGAGRERAGEPIDYDVGIVLDKVVGERVEEGQAWATLHHKEESVPEALLSKVRQAVVIDPKMTPFDTPSRVIKRITATSLSTL